MSRPLRIAMLAHSTIPRGGVVHAMNLCEALESLGCEAVLHAPDARGDGFFRPARCRTIAFPVLPAPRDTFAMVEQRVSDYVEWFRRPANRGFDLYHAHDGISGNALASLRDEGLITAHVRTVHHVDAFGDERVARLQARSIRTADARFVVSTHWRRQLAETFGVEAEISGNGVDLARYSSSFDGSEARLRARLNLGDGPVFLSVGGVEARKNTVRILQAFHAVRAERRDARLLIAGGASLLDHGAYQADFGIQLARMGDGAAAVVRAGTLADSDMPGLYRLATALAFASVAEGFGLCVLEALASGIPTVVSRIEPFVGYLGENDVLWCDPLTPASIAAAMQAALREDVAAAARKCGPAVAARFDWRGVALRHLPVYRLLRELAHA